MDHVNLAMRRPPRARCSFKTQYSRAVWDPTLALYLHLARAAELRRKFLVRDKLLVLCAVLAVERELAGVAAFCRRKVLAHNPGHMLGRFATVEEALDDPAFLQLLAQLKRTYPREKAEHMLASLGINLAREQETYFSEQEYAAALLGTTVQELDLLAAAEPPATNGGQVTAGTGDTAHAGQRGGFAGEGRDWRVVLAIVLISLATLAAAVTAIYWTVRSQ